MRGGWFWLWWIISIFLWVVFIYVTFLLAATRSLSPLLWVILAVFFPLITIIILFDHSVQVQASRLTDHASACRSAEAAAARTGGCYFLMWPGLHRPRGRQDAPWPAILGPAAPLVQLSVNQWPSRGCLISASSV